MVFPVLQCAAFPSEDVIKHRTTPHRSQAEERVSGCWEKSLKTATDPPSMENFAVKMGMAGVDEIQVLGGRTAVWPLSLLLAAETQTLPVWPCYCL